MENVKKVDELLWGYEEPLLVGATMVLPPEEVKVMISMKMVMTMTMTMKMVTMKIRRFGLKATLDCWLEGI